jgi:hypothetical protein
MRSQRLAIAGRKDTETSGQENVFQGRPQTFILYGKEYACLHWLLILHRSILFDHIPPAEVEVLLSPAMSGPRSG